MVVQGILALALALPTGLLFGVGYGTGVRIGYEQVYPLLFPPNKDNRNVTPTVENIKQINGIYNAIGGKEASQMGIAMGLQGAMEEIDRNPDFQALEALELRLSGRTSSRSGKEVPSKETNISDFPLGSSLDPNSRNFDPEYFIFVNKKKQEQDFPPGFDFGDKSQLNVKPPFIPEGRPPDLRPAIVTNTKEEDYVTWTGKRDKLMLTVRNYTIWANQSNSGGTRTRHLNTAKAAYSKLKTMSNDTRNPNNLIRVDVLNLRRILAQGHLQYPKLR